MDKVRSTEKGIKKMVNLLKPSVNATSYWGEIEQIASGAGRAHSRQRPKGHQDGPWKISKPRIEMKTNLL